jgi:hypothetical protein
MTIFAIISPQGQLAQPLRVAIETSAEYQHTRVNDGFWLVAAVGTAKDIADKLGVSEGQKGSAIVLEVASYWGRASPDLWSWIKTNWEATSG